MMNEKQEQSFTQMITEKLMNVQTMKCDLNSINVKYVGIWYVKIARYMGWTFKEDYAVKTVLKNKLLIERKNKYGTY